MKLAAAVMTIEGREALLEQTLRTLRAGCPEELGVVLALGSPGTEAPEGELASRINPSMWELAAKRPPIYRLTVNMWNAYNALLTLRPDADVYAVFEDDIVASSRWYAVAEFATRVCSGWGRAWGCSLCSSHSDASYTTMLPRRGLAGILAHRDARQFWGQQAMLYSPTALSRLRDFARKALDAWQDDAGFEENDSCPNFRLVGDQLVKWFFYESQAALYSTDPSVARHVGNDCTWKPGPSIATREPTLRFST